MKVKITKGEVTIEVEEAVSTAGRVGLIKSCADEVSKLSQEAEDKNIDGRNTIGGFTSS